MNSSYEKAGVSIKTGNEAVEKIKELAKSTFNDSVLSGIGYFGSFYQLDIKDYIEPVLVSSVDGVGTKLKIAFEMGRHDTIGQDLVNHCVNDIAVCGAEPLYFMDYLSFAKLDSNISTEIIKGFSVACRENYCALIGGETAEMPGFYQGGEYDISGTIVGLVEKSKIIDGSKIESGDIVIGITSNGLHTNGYSLAREVLVKNFKLNQNIEKLNRTLGEELLQIHKSYFKLIKTLKANVNVNGFAHITGGGIVGNTKRIVPSKYKLKIQWGNWEPSPVFKLIQEAGKVTDDEMRTVFNMGIGLVVIVSREQEELTLELARECNEHPLIIGEIE
ncbi:MAG: phosphoribosylformylglycinamidine cyclo-ligase [Ignavibacteria bacterium]|nr:phosphoribosylformylglycinamidine cyclo-ligase [Ignavibacteria bacterium]MBT8390321.1 phosphoribosylformylglycinamidine cyclo-ligase [Ignavibacteria bacterium]NNJ53349.1 phosphoribosylformylglycinamidine cyclo-ligase [Ignavibacteriaceae bacterium]NNL22471.1 phosphoribosylformylglycinamidine cyclo-ligase [Ignavibacteriaceae bacterium]